MAVYSIDMATLKRAGDKWFRYPKPQNGWGEGFSVALLVVVFCHSILFCQENENDNGEIKYFS